MLELSTKLEPVQRAKTAAQRDEIYRFRYAVRVEGHGQREVPGLDRERRMIRQTEDDLPSSIHLHTGSLDQLDACARLRTWAPGEVPDEVRDAWSLDFVTNLDDLAIAELADIVARPGAGQQRLAILSLFCAAFDICLHERAVDLIVFDAHPGLISHYAKLLGARRYGGTPVERYPGKGVGVPMVIVVSDTEHLERVASLFAAPAWKVFTLGRRRRADVGCFSVRFVDDLDPQLEPERSWPQMEQRFFRRGVERWSFFDGLREGVIEELLARGHTRELQAGELLVDERGGDRSEMFVVLDGSLEILAGGKSVDVAGNGELIGEIALLEPERRRTATIRALIRSRVLALDHQILRALALGDAEAGHQVMFNLARFIAERFGEKARLVAQLDEEIASLREQLDELREREHML